MRTEGEVRTEAGPYLGNSLSRVDGGPRRGGHHSQAGSTRWKVAHGLSFASRVRKHMTQKTPAESLSTIFYIHVPGTGDRLLNQRRPTPWPGAGQLSSETHRIGESHDHIQTQLAGKHSIRRKRWGQLGTALQEAGKVRAKAMRQTRM